IKPNEMLMINIGTGRSVGVVTGFKGKSIELTLKLPICADIGERIVVSRQILGRWRLIGCGVLKG
ncbi:MAG: translation initiation factor IF-2 subunit gamma, partial [Candidatus Aenigmarchaeota archaeon]|nr:translation initiation factor IF-2 subunit gamma [Candidatus Aenigmarchaeota archaeon]